MNDMSVTNRFIFLLGTFVAGFLATGWVALNTLNLAKVTGPIYKDVALQKDLVADILPPSEYLIEEYLVVLQLARAEAKDVPALVEKSKQLEADYEARHRYWSENLPDGDIKELILAGSYKPGEEFLKLRDERFIPAIQRGDKAAALAVLPALEEKYNTHRRIIDDLVVKLNEKTAHDEATAADIVRSRIIWMILLMAGIGVVVLVIGRWIASNLLRQLGGEPLEAADAARCIGENDFSHTINVKTGDKSSLMYLLKTLQAKLVKRQEIDDQAAREMSRLKCALDNVTMCVRVADNDGTVIYINYALRDVLHKYEKTFQQENPAFVADRVVGGSIGVFYADPAAALNRLRNLAATTRTTLTLGGRVYDVVTTPIFSETGERLGTVGQWIDLTEQLRAEKEISDIVEAAANGDFTHRVGLEGKQGFFLKLTEDINRLTGTSDLGLKEVARVLSALAKGDLTETISNDYLGTFGRLKNDSNTTVAKLTELISRIKAAADTINTAAKEISSGNTNLSQRTEEQASSLEKTAVSMDELTSTVKLNAENARQANQLALGASEVAVKGGVAVNQVVQTMSSISTSSNKIVDIISVIDGIAFQTNILALNAAVEAARAGEQGRGFAVVATEVRSLAQRSAAAAKEIKTLISDSVDKVGQGAQQVELAGKTMEDIVNAVKRVTDIMGEITAASIEQSQGIEQVSRSITQMDDATQQNAALVEQAAAAAESMEQQAQEMAQLMSIFRLSQAGGAAPAREFARLPAKAPRDFSFSDAIEAHTKWKARLVAYIKGSSTENLEVKKVSRDDQCPLGEWLYGSATAYARLPEYDELKKHHAAFHKGVGEIVQCVHDNKKSEATDKLGGDFFRASTRTVEAIKSLQSKVEGSAPRPRAVPRLSAKG